METKSDRKNNTFSLFFIINNDFKVFNKILKLFILRYYIPDYFNGFMLK